MWQLSWMVTLLPNWFWTTLLYGSIIAFLGTYILKFIPPFRIYANIIRPIALVIAFLAVYWQGGIDNELKWQKQVEEMEEKVRAAEEKSKEANTQIETKIVEKTKIVKEKGKIQIEYINRIVEGKTVEIIKDMSEQERAAFLTKQKELQDAIKNCPIPKIIVEEHNKAAESK